MLSESPHGHRTVAAWPQNTMPSESEALAAIQQMGDVLAQCGRTSEAAAMTTLLSSTQTLVDRARGADQNRDSAEPPSETVPVTLPEWQMLVLHRAVVDFECRLRSTVGEFSFKDGTISFGERADHWDEGRKQRITDRNMVARFKKITLARHSLFHVAPQSSELAGVLADMGAVLRRLDGINTGTPTTAGHSTPADWTWGSCIAPVGTTTVNVATKLVVTGQRMSIPKARERCLVGRDAEIRRAVDATLAGDHARVLVHGPPGMGKDVTAVEAVLDDRIKLNPQLTMQAWLQGSTDEMFRRQLVRLFATQHPKLVAGLENDQPAALAKVKQWLATNPSCWLFVVEDANAESRSTWSMLPAGAGRATFTSVEDLTTVAASKGVEAPARRGITEATELAAPSTDDSLEMLRRMNIFALKMSDVDLDESDPDLEARCVAARLPHTAPASRTEKSKAQKQRCRALQGALRAHAELGRPDLRAFLEEELGNLPLAVALNGQMLRDVRSVVTLIGLFKTAKLEDVDAQGRNPGTDRHLIGLYTSVRVVVERIKADPSLPEAAKKATMQLLVIISVLPRSETPIELFRCGEGMLYTKRLDPDTKVTVHGLRDKKALNGRTGCIVNWIAGKGRYAVKVEIDGSIVSIKPANLRVQDGVERHDAPGEAFDVAVVTLQQRGMLQRNAVGSKLVGNIHQLLQRCIR